MVNIFDTEMFVFSCVHLCCNIVPAEGICFFLIREEHSHHINDTYYEVIKFL